MNLSHLIDKLSLVTLPKDVILTGLSLDSRTIHPGDVFIACIGSQLDGRQFIDKAISQGATAVLVESNQPGLTYQNDIPIIAIPELKKQLGSLAARFYDFPAKKLRIVGVTGTSGKTSCTQFIGAVLHHIHQTCGIIGTLGNGLYGNIIPSTLTTPDAITIQKTLAQFVQQHATFTAMEVSSHSLDQGRVNGLEFDVGVFTNLTRDHLDYHNTMAEYGASKKRLFLQSRHAVINAEDPYGQTILKEFQSREQVYAYSTTKCDTYSHPAIYAKSVRIDDAGIHAVIQTPWGKTDLHSHLIGQFNLSNMLAVLTTLCLLDIPLDKVVAGLSQLTPVPGRMQTLGGKDKPLIVVDYAHKPDALEKVLAALRKQCQGKLYCVFGCGGERDRGKRPIMAKIAEQYADQVIVTDDNPRHEDPTQIVADILQGFTNPKAIIVEHDRSKAIQNVIQYAKVGDCVLVAGKGAETYQQIGDIKKPFSDIEKVKQVIG